MTRKLALAGLALSAFVSGPAVASTMVAGWDFSQYAVDGFLSIDAIDLTDTLSANYSDLDPPFGAGPESAAFGTMYLNGQFGSTDTPLDFVNDPFAPSFANPGSLDANLDAPAGVDFDSGVVLQAAGQEFFNVFAMTALGAATVVFEADADFLIFDYEPIWTVSFAGRTSTGAAPVQIELSTDGVAFTSFGTLTFDTADRRFEQSLAWSLTNHAYLRLTFAAPAPGQNVFLDNVAMHLVPEPGMAALLVAALLGVARAARRT